MSSADTLHKDITRRDVDFLASTNKEQRKQWIIAIVDRMMLAWGHKSKKELADELSLKEKAPSNWIQNGTVPWSAIFICSRSTGRSLDWLYYGNEPRRSLPETLKSKLTKQITSLVRLGCKMKLIKEVNNNGIETLSDTLSDEVDSFYQTHSEFTHHKNDKIA